MTTNNKATRLAKEQEATRIRGKEFEEWQKESAKIECNRARNAEVVSKQELEKKEERKKAQL